MFGSRVACAARRVACFFVAGAMGRPCGKDAGVWRVTTAQPQDTNTRYTGPAAAIGQGTKGTAAPPPHRQQNKTARRTSKRKHLTAGSAATAAAHGELLYVGAGERAFRVVLFAHAVEPRGRAVAFVCDTDDVPGTEGQVAARVRLVIGNGLEQRANPAVVVVFGRVLWLVRVH